MRAGGTPRACPFLALGSWASGRAGKESDPQVVAVQTAPATSTTGDGSGHPTVVGGAQAGLVLRPCGPKSAVPGH